MTSSLRFQTSLLMLVAFMGLSLASSDAGAQSASLGATGDEPLQINASDGIEWRRDEQQYIANGDARAAQGDLEVFADRLVAHYKQDAEGGTEIYRIDAVGSVIIKSPGREAFGDHGVYDIHQQVMVLTGNDLRIVSGGDVITARDSLEYWEGRQLAVARGDAIVTREDKRVYAQIISANFANNSGSDKLELDRVDAFNDVRISSNTEYATGNRGVYFVKKELATLDGNVKITQGDNQLNGDRGEVNLATGVSRLISSGNAPVQGLIIPKKNAPEEPKQP
ncbi:LptA/OstA family protein [Kiloniella sp. b19]|uniref:LptA/OstA family protein n=1 Tax=Kiloniella sp. GXU_MW_B19 TaxID=3141326 RepID=UPI0031E04B69